MSSADPGSTPIPAVAGAKMIYLIKRRPIASREELIAHWFANHMPAVVAAQRAQAEAGRLHARRYIATVFGASHHGAEPWDGMAQLWFERPPPAPAEPHGTDPVDAFQERAEPYRPWATTEYLVLDPSDRLPVEPLRFGEPFPTTRSGFHKITFLVAAKPDIDHDELFDHWLRVHVPNVRGVLDQVGGWGYAVSHSLEPATATYAGMAELYFDDEAGWAEYKNAITADGMARFVDGRRTVVLRSGTEMIGIA